MNFNVSETVFPEFVRKDNSSHCSVPRSIKANNLPASLSEGLNGVMAFTANG